MHNKAWAVPLTHHGRLAIHEQVEAAVVVPQALVDAVRLRADYLCSRRGAAPCSVTSGGAHSPSLQIVAVWKRKWHKPQARTAEHPQVSTSWPGIHAAVSRL